jgi:hypothetical protein
MFKYLRFLLIKNDCPNGLLGKCYLYFYLETKKTQSNKISFKLDKKTFVKVYKKFYQVGDPTEFCEHVFRVFHLV